MTCKECLHFDACITIFKEAFPNTTDKELDKIASRQQISRTCPAFKNKADFVEVVRCKDCKNFRPYDGEEHKGDCEELVGLESCVYEDDFCSYGERKDGAGE